MISKFISLTRNSNILSPSRCIRWKQTLACTCLTLTVTADRTLDDQPLACLVTHRSNSLQWLHTYKLEIWQSLHFMDIWQSEYYDNCISWKYNIMTKWCTNISENGKITRYFCSGLIELVPCYGRNVAVRNVLLASEGQGILPRCHFHKSAGSISPKAEWENVVAEKCALMEKVFCTRR